MDEMMLVNVNAETHTMTVSSRELHRKLEVQTEYRHWFPRMCSYGFEEGVDFNPVKNDRVHLEGGREIRREIWDNEMTIDMAKEICMLSRTPVGKKVRKYFIEVEKAWNSPEQVMSRALQLANQKVSELQQQCLLMENQVMEQQLMIEKMAPKARYVDEILRSKTLVLTTQIAKDYGMSAQKLNKILSEMGIQYKVNRQWVLYAKYQGEGYVHSVTITIPQQCGDSLVRMQTEWTQKGRLFLYEKLKEINIYPLIEGSEELAGGNYG